MNACTSSDRPAALQVAAAGSVTARQMGEYYSSLQRDSQDTYELNAFREAYLAQRAYEQNQLEAVRGRVESPPPPSLEITALDRALAAEYEKTWRALGARVRLAGAMQDAYESYARLAQYDASREMLDRVGGLLSAANGAAALPLPDPTGTVGAVTGGLFKDLVTQLTTLWQNRKLVRDNARLAQALLELQRIFEAERILMAGDAEVKDSTGQARSVSGIAGRRAAAYREVARALVEGEAVISSALINRVVGAHDLRWPDSQAPFSDPPLKAGILKLIEYRALPHAQASEDAGAFISSSLAELVVLHEQLARGRPPSLSAFLERSAAGQVALDCLRQRGIPADVLLHQLRDAKEGGPP
jgi:hypothetical protein